MLVCCILALKEHRTKVFQSNTNEIVVFERDLIKVSRVIYNGFNLDKINDAKFEEIYPHGYFRLVPNYQGEKSR
jgi:hypothetical protein